jgi:hypothetical protein
MPICIVNRGIYPYENTWEVSFEDIDFKASLYNLYM